MTTRMEKHWKKVMEASELKLDKLGSVDTVAYRLELVYDNITLTHKFYLSCMNHDCMLYEHGCFDAKDFHQILKALKRVEKERKDEHRS